MPAPKKKSFLHHARHTFLPLRGNNHHPHVLKSEVIFSILALAFILEVGVLAQGFFLLKNPNLMASVLPAAITDLTNTQRADNGLQALTVSPLLTEAAQEKANDMAARGYFSHVSPDGTLPWYWFKQVGYTYQFAGENLAINFNDSTDVVNAWMASPMHRANILKQQYTQVGIGIATGIYEGRSTIFVVQFFGNPKTQKAVPVAVTNQTQNIPAPTDLMTTSAGSASPVRITTSSGTAPTISTGTPTVLGIETNTPASPLVSLAQLSFLQKLLASPFSTANVLFAAVGAFFLAVLIAGFIHRKRLPRMTATIGGLSVVVVVLGFAILNTHYFAGSVRVDRVSASQSAAVVNYANQ